jgi:hypothetical protein
MNTDSWAWGPAIPARRRRGSVGAVVHDGSLILVCGIINGHTDGWVNWCDSYDFRSDTWSVLPNAPRARDHFEAAVGPDLIVCGGESMAQKAAHAEVQALNTTTGIWRNLPPLRQGRHGTGLVFFDGVFYTCAGAGDRGGQPLLSTMEMLPWAPMFSR